MERASGNYAFVRRVIEKKRTSFNYSFSESFACIQNANVKLRLRFIVIFTLVREELKTVSTDRLVCAI